MAYNLVRTDPFQQDLDAVIGYIALVLKNKVAAASLLDSVKKCYDEIERMPLMYEACRDPYLKSLGYRKAVIHNYVMVYKVDEERKKVYIMRFFHGSQDYEKLI
jgi:plasmid stabilization system protein ParE